MIGKTMKDIVLSLDLKKVFQKSFRQSLSRLVYSYERAHAEVREQIVLCMKCLESETFVGVLKETVDQIMCETTIYDYDLSAASIDTRDLQLSGTFQAALHAKIIGTISAIFSKIISHADKNCNMALALNVTWSERWIALFKKSFNINSMPSRMSKLGTCDAVVSDGFGGEPFRAQFPFSFYISSIFDSMRKQYEFEPEVVLRSQLEMVSLESFKDEQDEESMNAYMYDVCCMKFKEIKGYSRNEQGKIFYRILQLIANEDILSKGDNTKPIERFMFFSQVHYFLWRGERLIELYFELFGSNISKIDVLSNFLLNSATSFDDSCHKEIAQRFVIELEPWNAWLRFKSNHGSTRQQLNEWIDQIDRVKTTFLSILDLVKDNGVKNDCIENWSSLLLHQAFVRDIGIPLELDIAVLLTHVESLRHEFIVSKEMLCSLIKTLEVINIEILRQRLPGVEKFLCPITCEKLVDPVIASDGRTYERAAIEDWFQSGKSTSPCTNEILNDLSLKPNFELLSDIQNSNDCDFSRFLEYYLFDVVFKHNRSQKDNFVLMIPDLVTLASGRSPVLSVKDHYMLAILPSVVACRGILRELKKLSQPSQIDLVNMLIDEELLRARTINNQLIDTPFFVSVCSVLEEQMSHVPDPSSIDMSAIYNISSSDINLRLLVESVASIRCILGYFASSVCKLDDEKESSASLACINELVPKISLFLESSPKIPKKVTNHMRMFVLKVIERSRGQSYVRSVLMQEPIKSTRWLMEWVDSADISITQFLGKDKLPRSNPFVIMAYFRECTDAFSQFLSSGNIGKFESDITSVLTNDAANSIPKLRGAFLVAMFNEITLLSVLPTLINQELLGRIETLVVWCETSSFIKKLYNPSEIAVLLLLTTGKSSSKERVPAFMLDPDSSTDQIMQVRLAIHVVAVSLSASNGNPAAFLGSLIKDPRKTAGSFFPTMPEDLTKMAQTVMGGRWYACPKGHPFYVDACGGPTMRGICFCGEEIGGEDHNLLQSNIRIDGLGAELYQKSNLVDKSENNYCIRSAVEERDDRFTSRRGLNAVSIRIIRLLMHTVMYCCSCAVGDAYDQELRLVMNSSYTNPTDVNEFLGEHFTYDWSDLNMMLTRSVDDVSMIVHLILHSACGLISDQDIAKNKFQRNRIPSTAGSSASGGGGTGATSGDSDFRVLMTLQARVKWETIFSTAFISQILDNTDVDQMISSAAKQYGDEQDGESGLFTTDLLDKCDVSMLSLDTRLESAPGLWRYSKGFSIEHFVLSLQLVPSAIQRFPVLTSFMTDEIQLRALRYLPAVFEWISLLTEKYNGRLDKETARKKTCGELLAEIPLCDRSRWSSAFSGFCKAWNDIFSFVHRYGCLEIPATYREIQMDASKPMVFSLPCDKDEGLCTMGLVTFIKNKHNDMVQLVDETLLLRQRRNHREQWRAGVISSRFLTAAHSLQYNLETELIPFFEKQCMRTSEGGTQGYDFYKAEAMLVDRVLVNLPAIDLEQQGFSFSHEEIGSTGISILRQKVKQEPLARDISSVIKRDLSNPATALGLLNLVETAISFLGGTGGLVVKSFNEAQGDMLFSKYLKNILLVTEELQSRTVSQIVRLRHLESLYLLLYELTHGDFQEKISPLFRVEISDS
jgi:hypothetical protein